MQEKQAVPLYSLSRLVQGLVETPRLVCRAWMTRPASSPIIKANLHSAPRLRGLISASQSLYAAIETAATTKLNVASVRGNVLVLVAGHSNKGRCLFSGTTRTRDGADTNTNANPCLPTVYSCTDALICKGSGERSHLALHSVSRPETESTDFFHFPRSVSEHQSPHDHPVTVLVPKLRHLRTGANTSALPSDPLHGLDRNLRDTD